MRGEKTKILKKGGMLNQGVGALNRGWARGGDAGTPLRTMNK